MPTVTTDDGVGLHHTDTGGSGRPLVLVHGWTFSGRFFDDVAAELAGSFRVVAVDLRGHGDSDKPSHGYRVARLAADLRDLLASLGLTDAVLLGWSLGCPVIWSHLELFGTRRVGGAVFVQQPPRQYYAADWPYPHATCFDEPSLAWLQATVAADPAAEDRRRLAAIRRTEPEPAERDRLLAEMAKCPVEVRNAVMADHTRHDWRDLLPALRLPTLVAVAERDPVFDPRGPAWVGEAVPGAETVRFAESAHAPFLDEPARFVEVVGDFAARAGRSGAAR